MKLGEIMKVRGVLFRHKDDTAEGVPFKAKYKITKFLFDTDAEACFCEKSLKEIEAQCRNNESEYQAKINELMETEVDKNVQFTTGELEHYALSVEDLICLYGCITETEGET